MKLCRCVVFKKQKLYVQWLLFQWLYFGIPSTDLKVKMSCTIYRKEHSIHREVLPAIAFYRIFMTQATAQTSGTPLTL